MLTEVIRLPVPAGGEQAVLDFLAGHEFFRQEAVHGYRLFQNEDEPQVMVIMEWTSRDGMRTTTDNELSTSFRSELAPLLQGPPTLAFYRAEA